MSKHMFFNIFLQTSMFFYLVLVRVSAQAHQRIMRIHMLAGVHTHHTKFLHTHIQDGMSHCLHNDT